MGLAVLSSIGVAVFMVSRGLHGPSQRALFRPTGAVVGQRSAQGVRGRLTAGELMVERALPAVAFALDAGQSLDARLSAGVEFEGEFNVTVRPGPVRQARLGGIVQNGSIIIKR